MRRYLVAAGSFVFLLGSATAASAHDSTDDRDRGATDPVVVADGLDNPRQLAWSGDTLLIAEGGDDCAAPAAPTTPEPGTTPADTGSTTPTTDGTVPSGDDDGTADQGSGDVTPTPGSDDGTPDQGAGDVIPTPSSDDGTPDQGSGDVPTTPGDVTTDAVCDGLTGIFAVERPDRGRGGDAAPVVDRLFSVETSEGAVATGGVAAFGTAGQLLITQGEEPAQAQQTQDIPAPPDTTTQDPTTPTQDIPAPPDTTSQDPTTPTQGRLLLTVEGEAVPWVDLGQAEQDQNPDGNAVPSSNPTAVLVVDPTPERERGGDEFALVADAGANVVWKVTPDFSQQDERGLPAATVTVWTAFPADDATTPDFAPNALAQDRRGNVYVGGEGSLTPGAASVVRFDADGTETGRWDGFTGITGLAVERDGEHVFVAQGLGNEGAAGGGTGNVVRVDTEEETYATFDVPAPSGLALGQRGEVFVSAYSTSPAVVQDDPATADVDESTHAGQVWRFSFPRDAAETALPVTTPPTTTPEEGTVPEPTTPAGDDDGTADQGSGDVTTAPGDDDGTADQGSGDTVPTPSSDDGTPDQGSGDAATAPGDDDGTADQGSGDAATAPGDDDGTLDQGSGDVATP
ncbi:MAG TPA: ScyD/ScyE family protein [Geodermatophilus sp.]|nr:ScyD/ScyE family protein [Geodermatophilus sp.]